MVPVENCPDPNSNTNPKPNPNPNRGGGVNFPWGQLSGHPIKYVFKVIYCFQTRFFHKPEVALKIYSM